MTYYIVNATDLSGVTGTIEPDIGFRYTDKLNDVNEADVKISGTGSVRRTLWAIGSVMDIYRGGTLEFSGIVDNIDYLDGGGINVHLTGKELRLAQEKGVYAGSPWLATDCATIFTAIIGESSYFTAGTVQSGVTIDFRLTASQSLWNAMGSLGSKTGRDIGVVYSTMQLNFLIHKGSTTSVGTFNDGIHITNLRVSKAYPLANYVEVQGKGDGEFQIKSTSAHGQNAASQSTYGVIKHPLVDRSIMTVSEANDLADKEVARMKDPVRVYDFECLDTTLTIVSGDVITLNSTDKDLVNEDVRIVGIERGLRNGKEYLSVQVTNEAYSNLMKKRNELLGKIQKDNIDAMTYMQGNSNVLTWGTGINAKTNYPAKIGFQIPNSFIKDEANVLRISSMTLDYDIDPFNRQYGLASYVGSDPQVQNLSGNTQPDVSGTSGSTTPSNTAGVSVWATSTIDYQFITGRSYTYAEENVVGDSSLYTTRIRGQWTNYGGVAVTVARRMATPDTDPLYSSNYSLDAGVIVSTGAGESSANNSAGWFSVWDNNFNATVMAWGTAENIYQHTHNSHSHADGSYAAANHDHPDGSYDVNAADLNYVSIADDIAEPVPVNATSVNIYLDFWNGSAWVNKYSILATGATFGTDVDLTNGGTYPDAGGFWRVRLEPITVNPDFAQGIVKIKHNLDN